MEKSGRFRASPLFCVFSICYHKIITIRLIILISVCGTSSAVERMVAMSDNLYDNNNYNSDVSDDVPTSTSGPEHVSDNSQSFDAPKYNNPFGNYNNNTGNSYAYTAENSTAAPKHKKNGFLKAAAFILCIAIAGAAGAFGYKIYKDHQDDNELSEFTSASQMDNKAVDDEEEEESVSGSSDNYSLTLFDLAARDDAKPIPDIVEDIMPSVVGVSATFEFTQQYSFFGWSSDPTTEEMIGTGTGIIMSEDGYIVTNAHCIYDDSSTYHAGEAIEVSVLFSDESEHEAKIIAYDVETDIAILKVDETGLKPATFGDSDELRKGELVIAVGNPLGFDLFGTVTSGIVSDCDRMININDKKMNLIQTDAAINSGNSGGPLLNSCGQVIGINSAKMSSSYGSASIEGLGFAIPITEAKHIVDELLNNGYVSGRPQLGITTTEITETYSNYFNIPMGVYIREVVAGGAADLAGIQIGDVIIAVEDEPIKTTEELNEIKNRYKAGDTITLTISRAGQDIDVRVTLQDANADNASKPSGEHERR